MIAIMPKKTAKRESGDGGRKPRLGEVRKIDISNFIAKLQLAMADAKAVEQLFDQPGLDVVRMDGQHMGLRGLSEVNIYLANVRRATHRNRG